MLGGLCRVRSTHPALLKNGDGYSIEFSFAKTPAHYPMFSVMILATSAGASMGVW